MSRKLLASAVALTGALILACGGAADTGRFDDTSGSATDGGGNSDGGGTGDGGGATTTVAVTWSRTGIELDITDGSSAGYAFGVTETDPSAVDPWTGEDCYLGYTTGGGKLLEYCHPAKDGRSTYVYGGNPLSLDEAHETVFSDAAYRDSVTYYLEDLGTRKCWVWGDEPRYYDALGCTRI